MRHMLLKRQHDAPGRRCAATLPIQDHMRHMHLKRQEDAGLAVSKPILGLEVLVHEALSYYCMMP